MKQHLKLLVASLLVVALFATPAWAASYWNVVPPASGDFWESDNWTVSGTADYHLIQNNGTANIGTSGTIYRLYIGHSGTTGGSVGGTVNVNSGTLTATGQVNVGRYTDGDLGTLVVASGAGVAAANLYIGYGQDTNAGYGIATVEGSLTFSASAGIGYSGNDAGVSTGVLNVQNGGSVTGSAEIRLGYRPQAEGTLNVTGDDSLFSTTGELRVGMRGTGTVTVGSGGEVACGTLKIGNEWASAVGIVNLNSLGTLKTGKV
ncbi:MAG: hypothetical protein GX621_12215, partial [Pirellulaceae bacterium]|nr:hypothetical protein [Pirellulaceae bacterium]